MAGDFNLSIIMSYFAFKVFPFHLEKAPFHRINLVISYMIFKKILSVTTQNSLCQAVF